MFFIGIDVAKRRHRLAAITGRGGKVTENYSFTNTTEGLKQMLHKFFSSGITCDNSRVALEATGHYSRALSAHLVAEGFEIAEGNPLQTHSFARAQSIRKVKNDAVDALALAQRLLSRNPTATKLSSSEAACLKPIARFRTFQSQIIGDSERKVIAILDQVFPEYASFFSDVFGKSALSVLSRYPSARALSRAHLDSLASLLEKSSRGRLGGEFAHALREAARNSFATNAALESQSLETGQLIAQTEFTKKQLSILDKKIEGLLAQAQAPIQTIPGIGAACAAAILGEIGDTSRFAKPSSLVAFAGLDPPVLESGEFVGTRNHLSKRGSSYLRWALWIAADRAKTFDPMFGAYYSKKRTEGKCHKVAVSAVARKLCNTIFAALTRNTPYVCPLAR